MFEATGWTLDETNQSRIDADGHLETIIAYVYPKDAVDNPRMNAKQFKNALINYTTYNSIVNVQIKKCDSYVYYKDLTAVNNFESTYYD